MRNSVVLSCYQTPVLLAAREAGEKTAHVSLDLGLTSALVQIEPLGIHFPYQIFLPWAAVEEIHSTENCCYLVQGGKAEKIQIFSDYTNQLFSLMPTRSAPTMLISGKPMHRIKGTDPQTDTAEKIRTIRPVVGITLDTATGLGYTAIEAARTARRVITIELDPAALAIARLNPWSKELFDNPKIEHRIGDSFEIVRDFDDETFTRIIHDPPMLRLAGDLYSGSFYAELYRILKRGGRVFHYVGDPGSKSGRTVTRGVKRRLGQAGFTTVIGRPRAFGLVAFREL